MKRTALLLLAMGWVLAAQAQSTDSAWDFSGHSKFRLNYYTYPDDSVFADALGSSALDSGADARIKLSWQQDHWDFKADYQLIGIYADTLELAEQLPAAFWPAGGVISDERRWFDLTRDLAESSQGVLLHRLDRLSLAYTTEHTVWRFGRQAISWGNGMVFSPMDIFNPFDPSAVDKEYKTGDDMLYGQYLFNNGSDMQGVAVVRRNPLTGDVDKDQSSLAIKYHGFVGMNEFDLLVAEHYADPVIGAGGTLSLGGTVVRGDLTWTRTDRDDVFSAVSSISYSWTWGGKNVSGLLEYYYNGFGQRHSDYSGQSLLQNPDLLRRIERGELFTLARHYVAASAMVEITPLFLLTPNLFINLEDPSALLQVVAQYDWKQNLQLLGALNIPLGASGTEYGGIEAPADGRYFSSGPGLFAQLAWYF
ncbi:MAG: hypothetical protein V2I48_10110 [Xanthomonadales bacterium]|jgi:hypothetical protein|nr:hypothetical protein [Xanthomonadales bacterium]